jgi:hypothetical protein
MVQRSRLAARETALSRVRTLTVATIVVSVIATIGIWAAIVIASPRSDTNQAPGLSGSWTGRSSARTGPRLAAGTTWEAQLQPADSGPVLTTKTARTDRT